MDFCIVHQATARNLYETFQVFKNLEGLHRPEPEHLSLIIQIQVVMKNLVLRVALFVISWMLAPGVGWGQGWERVYDFGNDEIGRRVVETQDHHFVVAATKDEFVGAEKAVQLSKVDDQGNVIWSNIYPVPWIYEIVFLHERADGGLVMVTVENDSAVTKTQSVYWLFSSTGVLLERKVLNVPDADGLWVWKVDLLQDTM